MNFIIRIASERRMNRAIRDEKRRSKSETPRRPGVLRRIPLLLLALLTLLAGCEGGGLPDDFAGKHSPGKYGNTTDDGSTTIMGWSTEADAVYALAEQEVYGPDSAVSLVLFNTSEENLFYGIDYRIEMKTGGAWTDVPFGQTVGIDSPGIRLAPNEVWRQQVQLEDFPPGLYRYAKDVELEESGGRKTAYGQFTVKSADSD
ncbi:hypothetical protein QWJ34_09495 [Saccharibacillus sp. CPCC 101409]|uniref:immunoglobulin-like domain-containing protein n=1 Tax=Saccharibacillus sp. CPCC 101409 TaxID=3058041 RepID=UPI002672A886|nr:immunoglobulin-like domain-containing protein [Saccharibacillus sp. CPCC 101409]MDO3409993.1 hypothetical protein [Saccharibacillus sp. CPCC 101409]